MANLSLYLIVITFGLCIGSFLNVCIYRIPENLSIAYPPSNCPLCKNKIKFYDNIPVLSYLILMGKCRDCNAPISLRYPAIEVLTGFFAFLTFFYFGFSINFLIIFLFICLLIIISFIDLDHQIIPNIITYPGIPLFFILSFVFYKAPYTNILLFSGTGILVGYLSLSSVNFCYKLLTGKDGMGGGDFKLLAMTGAITGWKGVAFTIFTSSLLGTIIGISFIIIKGKSFRLKIPFGPFLSAAAVIYIFYGRRIIFWYLNSF